MAQRPNTNAAVQQIKPATLRTFHQALMGWYNAYGRHDLPWRNTGDAYPIWLSEVMLQQTQVSTVLARFYHPFLKRFPTVEALADAPREAVMKAWEGLGYYSRAANLHKTAIAVTEAARATRRNSPATLPDNFDALLALPGIGRNTAHAVLAFAFHQPVAIMEANVKRIVARVFAYETPTDEQLWSGAKTLLDSTNPFHHNQAMMDLGAAICTPKNPACGICPAAAICKGKTDPTRYPAKKNKKQIPTREVIITVRQNAHNKLYLTTRSDRLLGGLYGFPQTPTETIPAAGYLGKVTHTYSHFKCLGHVVIEHHRTAANAKDWYSRDEITALPLSTLDHKVLALVENCNRSPKKRADSTRTRAKH